MTVNENGQAVTRQCRDDLAKAFRAFRCEVKVNFEIPALGRPPGDIVERFFVEQDFPGETEDFVFIALDFSEGLPPNSECTYLAKD